MAQRVAIGRVFAPARALIEREERSYRVKRGTLPEKVHVLQVGRSIMCNPTGLGDNKLCAVAFPSKPLLESVNAVLGHRLRITDMSTDSLLDWVDGTEYVRGVFQVNDCFCRIRDKRTFYEVTQIESEGCDALVSERIVEFHD